MPSKLGASRAGSYYQFGLRTVTALLSIEDQANNLFGHFGCDAGEDFNSILLFVDRATVVTIALIQHALNIEQKFYGIRPAIPLFDLLAAQIVVEACSVEPHIS